MYRVMFSSPALIASEAARLITLQRYNILDTPPDGAFDAIARVAAQVSNCAMSTVSIVDHDRIWFKASHGLPGVQQVDREAGLCGSVIYRDRALVLGDTHDDPVACHNSLVTGKLAIRFYVGVPLITQDGYCLGSLAVFDQQPKTLADTTLATLEDLASIVIDELELRLATYRTLQVQQLEIRIAELEHLNQAKEDFLSTLSHELRTPLATMRMALQMAKSVTNPTNQQRYFSQLEDALQREISLVDDLLLLQSIDDYRQRELVSLATVIDACMAQTHSLFKTLQQQLHLEIEPISWKTNAILLSRIVVELLTNAAKYSPPSSTILLRINVVNQQILALSVVNPDAEIPADELPFIFDKFYRVPQRDRWKHGGTGLGLALVKAAVHALGGVIVAESTPTQTSFQLTLPS